MEAVAAVAAVAAGDAVILAMTASCALGGHARWVWRLSETEGASAHPERPPTRPSLSAERRVGTGGREHASPRLTLTATPHFAAPRRAPEGAPHPPAGARSGQRTPRTDPLLSVRAPSTRPEPRHATPHAALTAETAPVSPHTRLREATARCQRCTPPCAALRPHRRNTFRDSPRFTETHWNTL